MNSMQSHSRAAESGDRIGHWMSLLRRAASAGAASGLAMALGEYVYLSVTVEQFSGPGELVLFAGAILALYGAVGSILGVVLAMTAHGAFFGVRKTCSLLVGSRVCEEEKDAGRMVAPARPGWVTAVQTVGVTLCALVFVALFLVDALAYHRLYFRYHVFLEVAEYLVGLIWGLLVIRLVVGHKQLAEKVVRRSRLFVAFWLALAFIAALPLSVLVLEDENLRMLVSDRGLVSAKFFALARSMADRDSDGYAAAPFGYDCDDSDSTRHPMAHDVPGDGKDQDCTGRDRAIPRPLPDPPLYAKGPKRIYLITIDAVRLDAWLLLAGRGLVPTLAGLSRRGAFFVRAHAPSSWTIPSVHSMMTGRYPDAFPWVAAVVDVRDRVALLRMDDPFARSRQNAKRFIPAPAGDRSPTLAEELSRRGYATLTVQDTLMFKKEMGMARGFQIVDDSPYKTVNMSLTAVTSPTMVRRALADILEHRDGPFFFYMHMGDPHAPYRVHPQTPPATGSDWDRYLGEIRFVDFWLGRFFAELDRNGLLADSLVVIAADHGEEFREHGGRFHATTVYEEVLSVPLLLVGPGIQPGIYRQMVSLVDLFPTILSFADGRCGRNLASGRDLCPLVSQGRTGVAWPHRVVYAQTRRFFNRLQAVFGRRYKLIRDVAAGASALFDLERDPGETTNVIGEHPKRAAGLLRAMNRILDAP